MKKLFVSAVVLASTISLPCSAQKIGTNLLTNSGAEAGAGSPQCAKVPVPGWTTTGDFTVGTYGGRSDVLSATSPGPSKFGQNGRGTNFFCGGNSANASASQTIDLSSLSNDIDQGNLEFKLSGWLGGFETDDDNATLVAIFNSQQQSPLSKVELGPVKSKDRLNQTSLVFKSTAGHVPNGTRSVTVSLNTERLSGSLADAYADNISFSIDKKNATTSSSSGSSGGPSVFSVGSGGASSGSSSGSSSSGSISGSVSSTNTTGSTGTTGTSSSGSTGNAPVSTSNAFGTFAGAFLRGLLGGAPTTTTGTGTTTGTTTTTVTAVTSPAIKGIVRSGGETTISLDTDLMFDNGKWELKPSADQALEQVRQKEIAGHIRKPIVVSGHADELPDDGDNLALSTMRALSVVAWMAKHGIAPGFTEVHGFGKNNPVASSNFAPKSNRRIEIELKNSSGGSFNTSNISGNWNSTFGPLTLVVNGNNVTGHWEPSTGRRGEFIGGSFDQNSGKLTLHYTQSWDGANGIVHFERKGPRNFSGPWSQVNNTGQQQSGIWTITR